MPTFHNFGLDPTIVNALEKMNYLEATPVQAEAIPLIKQNKDLIVLSETGSGKTAACAIPICDKVSTDSLQVQALIIVPTRELALQYATEVQKIGSGKKVKAFAVYGGEDASMQLSKLKSGVQVLIATPGRLIDFIYSRSIDLSCVKTLILDEADEMLNMGFSEDLEFIIQCLVQEHQTLLFSATMPKQIMKIAKTYMKEPLEIKLTKEEASPLSIEHKFLYCHHLHRIEALTGIIQHEHPKQGIIFCHSRIEVEKVCRELQKHIEGIDYLHAGLSQDIRGIITNKFRANRIRFLVATDVAARGLDFSGVTHVFIYHLADDPEIYVHRSGRTGRSGRSGMVITLVTERELPAVRRVLNLINREPVWIGSPPPHNTERKGSRKGYRGSRNRQPKDPV